MSYVCVRLRYWLSHVAIFGCWNCVFSRGVAAHAHAVLVLEWGSARARPETRCVAPSWTIRSQNQLCLAQLASFSESELEQVLELHSNSASSEGSAMFIIEYVGVSVRGEREMRDGQPADGTHAAHEPGGAARSVSIIRA